jgi:hypothetical protein
MTLEIVLPAADGIFFVVDNRMVVKDGTPGSGNNPENHPPAARPVLPRKRTIVFAVSSSPMRRSLLAA